MELQVGEVELRSQSDKAEMDSGINDEMNLYDDLMAFTASTAERQAEGAEQIQSDGHTMPSQPSGEPLYPELECVEELFSPHETEQEPAILNETPSPAVGEIESPASKAEATEMNDAVEINSISQEIQDLLRASGPLYLRDSGPLASFYLSQNLTGSPRLTCASCGNQSEGEDMFCMLCGSFLESPEAGEAPEARAESALACKDCGSAVEEAELFCPSCGSVLN